MRAALILRLARTRRFAIVGSATRKDLATSSVDSPPSRRSVNATCASRDSAGWQQVKINRSRSSYTITSSSGSPRTSPLLDSSVSSPSSSRPRDSRRSRSMPRLRAVVVIQPPGFGGRPSRGHLRSAIANASWTASSARSMSPKTRIRLATACPDSSRKIRPTSASSSAAERSRALSAHRLIREPRERAHLDGGVDRGGDLRGPSERGVEVLGLDDVEAGEVLLRLGEGAVRRQHLAVRHTHDCRRVGFVQPTREAPGAARLHLPLDGADPAAELAHLLLGPRLPRRVLDRVRGK